MIVKDFLIIGEIKNEKTFGYSIDSSIFTKSSIWTVQLFEFNKSGNNRGGNKYKFTKHANKNGRGCKNGIIHSFISV
jgi:hypothetical protein